MILGMQHRGYPVTARSWGTDDARVRGPDGRVGPGPAYRPAPSDPVAARTSVRLRVARAGLRGHAGSRCLGQRHSHHVRDRFHPAGLGGSHEPDGRGLGRRQPSTPRPLPRPGSPCPSTWCPGESTPRLFRPALRPLRIPGVRGTVFLSIFEWAFRKGWDVLLSAWAEAFSPEDDVSLVLRTAAVTGTIGTPAPIEQRIDDHLAVLGKGRTDVAPIIVLERPLSRPTCPGSMRPPTCTSARRRGEGWGRPLLEAMACRLPVVATRWSGNLAFMNDENSLLLDIEGLRADRQPSRVRVLPRPPLGRALADPPERGARAPVRRPGVAQAHRGAGPKRRGASLAVEARDPGCGRSSRGSGEGLRFWCDDGLRDPERSRPTSGRSTSTGRATSMPTTAWPGSTAPWPPAWP